MSQWEGARCPSHPKKLGAPQPHASAAGRGSMGLFMVWCFGLATENLGLGMVQAPFVGPAASGNRGKPQRTAGTRTWPGLCFPRLWPGDGSRAQTTAPEACTEGGMLPLPCLEYIPASLCPAFQGTLQPGQEPVRRRALPGPNPCQAGQAVQPP